MIRPSHLHLFVASLLLSACSSNATPPPNAGGGTATGASSGTGANASSSGTSSGGTPPPTSSSSGSSGGTADGGGAAGSSNDPATGSPDGGPSPGGEAGADGTGDGDYTVGPTYTTSPDLMSKGAPAGQTFQITMNSTSSQIFTGMDPNLLPANQHSFTRQVTVYVPAKYVDGTAAPFMVIQDGPGTVQVQQTGLLTNTMLALDNLTQSTDPTRRLPAFVAIAVENGGGDGPGSERGFEYDTMSDRYGRFIQTEVLPAVLADAALQAAYPSFSLTTDPDGRGALGCSSGSPAAMGMGWFHPEWFHRIVTYSGSFVDLMTATAPERAMYPFGSWEYHSDLDLIGTTTPAEPLRVFVNANEMDNGYTTPDSGHKNWLLANQHMAAALKAQGYHYRYVEGLGAGHCDGRVQNLTLADTLLWAWQDYLLN
jgi:enterochelin esterase-like enzyme